MILLLLELPVTFSIQLSPFLKFSVDSADKTQAFELRRIVGATSGAHLRSAGGLPHMPGLDATYAPLPVAGTCIPFHGNSVP